MRGLTRNFHVKLFLLYSRKFSLSFQIQVDAMVQLVSQPDELLGIKQLQWPQRNKV